MNVKSCLSSFPLSSCPSSSLAYARLCIVRYVLVLHTDVLCVHLHNDQVRRLCCSLFLHRTKGWATRRRSNRQSRKDGTRRRHRRRRRCQNVHECIINAIPKASISAHVLPNGARQYRVAELSTELGQVERSRCWYEREIPLKQNINLSIHFSVYISAKRLTQDEISRDFWNSH